jgi:TRAP transporter TAXI family solute receptor
MGMMMNSWIRRAQLREMALIVAPALLLILAAFAVAYQFVEPAPPRKFVMSTGSVEGAYHAFGKKYAEALKRAGVTLELRPSAGSLENIARLNEPASGVQAAFVQGGLTDAVASPDLASLGRMFLEPLWVFYRADLKLERLSDLSGKRISGGKQGSGTRPLVARLLKANGVSDDTATFVEMSTAEAASALTEGRIDAMFFTMAAEGQMVQTLLRTEGVRLYNFAQAEAYARIFPYLVRIQLPAGVADLVRNVPPQDVALLAPAASLVIRSDLHPALVGLLVNAAKDIHANPGLFQKSGEYPQAVDTELPMDGDAARFYKNGAPFLQRYLPFWLATFLERTAVMILPIATVLLPLFKVIPMIYQWRIKRRIFYWYDQLKRLERRVRTEREPEHFPAHRDEIHRIEDAVSVIPIPLAYSDQLYSLRSAIDLVRNRIAIVAAQPG